MKILKNIDERKEDLEKLESLLKCRITQAQSQRIKKEIAIIKKGVQGEKATAFALKDHFLEHSIVSHGLRLEIDGDVAQIDHLVINKHGSIIILETKNFSNDVWINDDGVFSYKKGGEYHPFPSPIEQANRQAHVLQKIIKEIGFKDIGINVLVVFGYGAKIYKPKKGFECVCYPDFIRKAHKNVVDKIPAIDMFKVIGTLISNKLSEPEITPEDFMTILIEKYHKPIAIDFEKKFGLSTGQLREAVFNQQETIEEHNPKNDSLHSDVVDDSQGLTIAKICKLTGQSKKEFLNRMINLGLIEIRENGHEYPTALGKKKGISLKKGKFGYFLSFDSEKIRKFINI